MNTPPLDGACVGQPTVLFFPNSKGWRSGGGNKKAMAICSVCPRIQDCLEYALVWEQYGIWGGTTELQRERIRKERGIKLQKHNYLLPVVKSEQQDSGVDILDEDEYHPYGFEAE